MHICKGPSATCTYYLQVCDIVVTHQIYKHSYPGHLYLIEAKEVQLVKHGKAGQAADTSEDHV